MVIEIFHCLENKNSKDDSQLLNEGPEHSDEIQYCGSGYYFWDSLIENAFWWKEKCKYDSYAILQAELDFNNIKVFDIYGDVALRKLFKELVLNAHSNGELGQDYSSGRFIEKLFLSNGWQYEAVRVKFESAQSGKKEDKKVIQIKSDSTIGNPKVINVKDENERVHVCIKNKEAIKRLRFKVAFNSVNQAIG